MKIAAEDWALKMFGECDLGDKRRTDRAVKLGSAFARASIGTLPGSMPAWPDQKGGYRFLKMPEVTFEALQRPHWEHTLTQCQAAGEYLLIEDTTDLNFTRPEPLADLGWSGHPQEQGFLLHSTLACRVERWNLSGEPEVNLMGVFRQQLWSRKHQPSKVKESYADRLKRQRESQRWAAFVEQTGGPACGVRWTYVADRESDIFDVFQRCRAGAVDWVIRASSPRKIMAENVDLLNAARQATVRGCMEYELRARPGQAARTVKLELHAREVEVRSPAKRGGPATVERMWVLAALEKTPPEGTPPIEWILLTTHPCDTEKACVRIMKVYSKRWLIEEYHKALKSGVGIENSQLESAHGLQALIGILALVAMRLLKMKLLRTASSTPENPSAELAPEALELLGKLQRIPAGGWTPREILRAFAREGGFPGRKGDGEPGWLTIWRGWNRFVLRLDGYVTGKRCG